MVLCEGDRGGLGAVPHRHQPQEQRRLTWARARSSTTPLSSSGERVGCWRPLGTGTAAVAATDPAGLVSKTSPGGSHTLAATNFVVAAAGSARDWTFFGAPSRTSTRREWICEGSGVIRPILWPRLQNCSQAGALSQKAAGAGLRPGGRPCRSSSSSSRLAQGAGSAGHVRPPAAQWTSWIYSILIGGAGAFPNAG